MEKKPALATALVNEMVLKSHSDLTRVQELVAQEAALVNAVWDWGGGDFESAIGAAAHTGQRAIALFLLENGARMDLYVAAMLGKLDVVKSILAAFPNARHIPGAHGIPLLVHAQMGGTDAAAVVAYLESLGEKVS